MKVIILAGGLPSTISEENEGIPKPMAEIGGRPILWHIMKQYSYYGYNDFIICTGYKGQMIKEYFMDYYIYQSDITVDLQTNQVEIHRKQTEDWKVSVMDTGLDTPISGRILKALKYVGEEAFLVSYGDCVSNINIFDLVHMHQEHGRIATVSVAQPTGRNEVLTIDKTNSLANDSAKVDAWVNACTMVLEPNVIHYLDAEDSYLERGLFERLSQEEEITFYRHRGFWSPMETKRDRSYLEQMWQTGKAPWKVWD